MRKSNIIVSITSYSSKHWRQITKRAIWVVTFIIASAVIAEAADWVLVSIDIDDGEHYVDSSSIKTTRPGIVRAEIRRFFPSGHPSSHFEGKTINYATGLTEFDCSEDKLRYLSITFSYSDGTDESATDENDENAEWYVIRSGSSDEELYEFACARG